MSHPDILIHRRCRVCGGDLQEVLNLGNLRLNAFPQHAWEIPQIQQTPLILTVCTTCTLVQLDRTVPPDWLYRQYWYRSGVNESMVQELYTIVEEARRLVQVTTEDQVLDIGANDGTLLHQYTFGVRPIRVAVEPALNLVDRLDQHCELRVSDYFPSSALETLGGTYKIITAVAMCYDLEDPLGFFQGIQKLLHPEGVAMVQFQDLGQMLSTGAFDNICHEHLEYYTLWSLIGVVERAGLLVQSCHQTPINGGSLRVVLRKTVTNKQEWQVDDSVAQQLQREQDQLISPAMMVGGFSAFTLFRRRVAEVQRQIQAVLTQARQDGAIVDIYGASTKGNVLLQVLGIGPSQVRQAIDRSPEKVGHYTITGIPIVSEKQACVEPADLWLAPIWQFRESVLRREKWYLQQGGQICFPLPQCEVVKDAWRLPVEQEI